VMGRCRPGIRRRRRQRARGGGMADEVRGLVGLRVREDEEARGREDAEGYDLE
jgi:hypothetical protein